MFYKNPSVSQSYQKGNFSTYDQHNPSLTTIINNFSQYQQAYRYCNTPSASSMAPKKLPKDIKKPSQGNDKPPKDGDKPANDDKKSTKDGKGSARDDGQRESSRPPTARERTNTDSSTGGGKLKSIASSLGGSPSKSGSKAATSEGNVKLFKSIKGTDGKVSPKKLLGVIFENMTVTPAMRGRKFTATAPKEISPSPESEVAVSDASSPPRWDADEGEEEEEGHWPAHAGSVPVSNSGNSLPEVKPLNWIMWHIPHVRTHGKSSKVVGWKADGQDFEGCDVAGMDKGGPEAIKNFLVRLKDNNEPGKRTDLTIHLHLYKKIEEYDDQTSKDVMKSLDEILKQGNGLNIQVNVMFSRDDDPDLCSDEATNPTINWVKVILMLLQDQYDVQAQTAGDAVVAREYAQRDAKDDRQGHREGREGRKKVRQGSAAHGGPSDEISVHDWNEAQGRPGQASRSGSQDSVGTNRSNNSKSRRMDERVERGQEGYHAEFGG